VHGHQVFATSEAKMQAETRLMDFGASDGISIKDISDWGKAKSFERTGGV